MLWLLALLQWSNVAAGQASPGEGSTGSAGPWPMRGTWAMRQQQWQQLVQRTVLDSTTWSVRGGVHADCPPVPDPLLILSLVGARSGKAVYDGGLGPGGEWRNNLKGEPPPRVLG